MFSEEWDCKVLSPASEASQTNVKDARNIEKGAMIRLCS